MKKTFVVLAVLVMLCLGSIQCASAEPVQWSTAVGGNSHWYEAVYVPAGISWTSANAAATAAGGHLATITSETENQFVYNLISDDKFWFKSPNYTGPWLGGYQDRNAPDYSEPAGGWRWVTNEPLAYTNWFPGYLDNGGGVEDCMHFFGDPSAKTSMWNDVPNDTPILGYVVEYEYTISAKVTLRQYDSDRPAVPITVELLQGGAIVRSKSVFLDSSDRFVLSGVTDGVYDVRVKASHWLSALRANRMVTGDIDLGTLVLTNGDCDGDDEVTSTDLSILGLALGSTPGSSNWDATTDLDGDEEITSTDLSILGLSLGKAGEVVETTEYVYAPSVPSGNAIPVVNVSETYTTSSTSSQGHLLEYSFNWGDGTSSPWSTSASTSHTWSSLGTKTVTVSARCQAHPSLAATSVGLTVDVNGGICEMIYIPAGSFLMGSSGVGNDARYSRGDEIPQHSVNLSAYYIGKYEVTRGEYRQFMNAGGYSNSAYWSTDGWAWKVSNSRTEPSNWSASQNWGSPPGTFTQTDNHPVVGVSYYEAEAFCDWAGGHLPTEAQWERAARWNPSTNHPNVYPWGDVWDAQKCNSDEDSLYPGYQTSPVGSYTSYPSPSGCQDMAGNVWEWCKDWYDGSYYSVSPGIDPPGPAGGSSHVLRGGAWSSYPGDNWCRCAFRHTTIDPNYTSNKYGFRLAR